MKAKSKPTTRIVLEHRGVLGAFGYHAVASLSLQERRAALHRAASSLGWPYLVKRLNVLYIFNKNRHPALAAKFKADRMYASSQLSL